MDLSSRQLQYLLVGHGCVPFAINFALNGATGWLMFRGVDPVPTWGIASSAGPDLIGTCFFLPAITSLIVTPIVRRHARSGLVRRVSEADLPSWMRSFHRALAIRAVLFGLACLVVVGTLLAGVLLLAGPAQLGLTPFLWLKASFSALLGALVTPVIALVALADASRSARDG
jgi:hypothetical protein